MAEHKPLKRELTVKSKFCSTQVWGQSCARDIFTAVKEQEVQDLQTDTPTERWCSYNTTGLLCESLHRESEKHIHFVFREIDF